MASKTENSEAKKRYGCDFDELGQLKQQVVKNIIKGKAKSRAKPDPEKELMRALLG